MNIRMLDMHSQLTNEFRSFLMPLEFFYSKKNSSLPEITPALDSAIPETERSLLSHDKDMTSTLSNHHNSDLYIEVLHSEVNEDYLLRMVVLKTLSSNKPVEFGAIGIDIAKLNDEMVMEIKEGFKPLGKLLEIYNVNYISNPRGYFQIKIDDYISEVLDAPLGGISYGRCNEITDSEGFTIADIVEVLP